MTRTPLISLTRLFFGPRRRRGWFAQFVQTRGDLVVVFIAKGERSPSRSTVPSGSWKPTLLIGECALGLKNPYGLRRPPRCRYKSLCRRTGRVCVGGEKPSQALGGRIVVVRWSGRPVAKDLGKACSRLTRRSIQMRQGQQFSSIRPMPHREADGIGPRRRQRRRRTGQSLHRDFAQRPVLALCYFACRFSRCA